MIEKIKVLELVQNELEGSDKFLVNLKITPDNRIYIDIDGDNGINIDDCIALSRAVESGLNRDEEDFELSVSSPGADQPLKMTRQYRRHVGRELEVTCLDGQKVVGELTAVAESGFTLHLKGTKKTPPKDVELPFADVKSAVVAIKF